MIPSEHITQGELAAWEYWLANDLHLPEDASPIEAGGALLLAAERLERAIARIRMYEENERILEEQIEGLAHEEEIENLEAKVKEQEEEIDRLEEDNIDLLAQLRKAT